MVSFLNQKLDATFSIEISAYFSVLQSVLCGNSNYLKSDLKNSDEFSLLIWKLSWKDFLLFIRKCFLVIKRGEIQRFQSRSTWMAFLMVHDKFIHITHMIHQLEKSQHADQPGCLFVDMFREEPFHGIKNLNRLLREKNELGRMSRLQQFWYIFEIHRSLKHFKLSTNTTKRMTISS